MQDLGNCPACGQAVQILDEGDKANVPLCTCKFGLAVIREHLAHNHPAWSWGKVTGIVEKYGKRVEDRVSFLRFGVTLAVRGVELVDRAAKRAERCRFRSSWERIGE